MRAANPEELGDFLLKDEPGRWLGHRGVTTEQRPQRQTDDPSDLLTADNQH